MKQGKITIRESGVNITAENGTVWMSEYEIARLFDVFMAKVTSNIKAVFKSGVLSEREVCYCHRYENGGSVDLYNLEGKWQWLAQSGRTNLKLNGDFANEKKKWQKCKT